MTKRPNDETPAPDADVCGIEERREAIRNLARRLFASPVPTSALFALLDEDKAPLWAFAEFQHLAKNEAERRGRCKEIVTCSPQKRGVPALTFSMLDVTIKELQKELGRCPKAAEVCRRLSDKRKTTEDTEKRAVRRLLASIIENDLEYLAAIDAGIEGEYWSARYGDCEARSESMTLTEYIKYLTHTPEEIDPLF